MQNMEVDPEVSVGQLKVLRVIELTLDCSVSRNKRYHNLDEKYRKERAWLSNVNQELKILHQKINNLCKQILSTTLNINARSETVIVAILNNMFAEKAAIDDLFGSFKTPYASIEEDLGHFEYLLHDHMTDFLTQEDIIQAESMLPDLSNQMETMSEMVSGIYQKCLCFLCTLERTLQKIDVVSKR